MILRVFHNVCFGMHIEQVSEYPYQSSYNQKNKTKYRYIDTRMNSA